MKVLAREGNTLSPVIRNAWDGKTLQTMAKNSPLRATGAHIGIVGHITKQELLRHITATELANGFFNRFMVVAVQRSKTLPFGGRLEGESSPGPRAGQARCPRSPPSSSTITFDPQARERWIAAYDELSRGEPGLAGAATARAEAHTVRLALLYALLDCSDSRSSSSTSRPRSRSGPTAPRPPAGCSATASATRPPTRSGRSPATARRHHPHRGLQPVLTEQESPRDRPRTPALIDAGRLERATIRDPRTDRTLTVWRPERAGEAR